MIQLVDDIRETETRLEGIKESKKRKTLEETEKDANAKINDLFGRMVVMELNRLPMPERVKNAVTDALRYEKIGKEYSVFEVQTVIFYEDMRITLKLRHYRPIRT